MKKIRIEVLGPEPPCPRCQAVKEAVEKVAEKLKAEEISVHIGKLNTTYRDVVTMYEALYPPVLVVNGVVKIMGRIPTEEEVEKLLKDAE